ncbi:MAG: DUF1501 domain-containing protein [Planctomyces sp.]|nr:DUF1501 domain-containing protein [Planctomyces sp.]
MSGRNESQCKSRCQTISRRSLLGSVSGGLYGAALAQLLGTNCPAEETATLSAGNAPPTNMNPRPPHAEPRAKSVIHLFMNGGPSQMDLFDPKPVLDAHHGEKYFDRIAGEVESPQSAGALMRSQYKFAQHGQCGMWMSDALPNLSRQVDDIAMIRSMYTTNITHEPAIYIMQSGKMSPGRPTLGSWVVYGLGSECRNLPAYVVLDDPLGLPVNGVENWEAGFLSPMFQGTRFRSTGTPVLNLRADVERPVDVVNSERQLIAELDVLHQSRRPGQSVLAARIASYELAARMQISASEALDLSQETQSTLDMYGIGREPTDSYGRRCLMARRLIERGVRFVQLFVNGNLWDHHTGLLAGLKTCCDRTDLPIAGLIRDLKQRGLFDSTLVAWGSEFGRLPIAQLAADRDDRNAGRDHNKNAFSVWLAGAGIQGGTTHGATDELGLHSVEDRVSVPDWHATVLHLLGLDHRQLFVLDNGLKEKLTGVEEARIVKEILK